MIDVVRQCRINGVPVFVKQVEVNGKTSHNADEWPGELKVGQMPNAVKPKEVN